MTGYAALVSCPSGAQRDILLDRIVQMLLFVVVAIDTCRRFSGAVCGRIEDLRNIVMTFQTHGFCFKFQLFFMGRGVRIMTLSALPFRHRRMNVFEIRHIIVALRTDSTPLSQKLVPVLRAMGVMTL